VKLQRISLKKDRKPLIEEKLKWVALRDKLHRLNELREIRQKRHDYSIHEVSPTPYDSYTEYVAIDTNLWSHIQSIDSRLLSIDEKLQSLHGRIQEIKRSSGFQRRNRLKKRHRSRSKLKRTRRRIQRVTNLLSTSDPYTRFYRQAEFHLSNLIAIRRHWDQYVVPRDTPGSTRIPTSFVKPSPPTDHAWSMTLASRRRTQRV
jgi:hypothetical protein